MSWEDPFLENQAGLKALQALSERVAAVHLQPDAKDINDYVLAGGELWPWLKGELECLGLVGELIVNSDKV